MNDKANEPTAAPDLKCHVCGEPIGEVFYLVAETRPVEQVYVVSEKCRTTMDEDGGADVRVTRDPI